MSKLLCRCGHIIVDQTDNISYKAAFFPDEDYEASYDRFITFCENLVQAREEGRATEFIVSRFGEAYPKDLSVGEMISDSLAGMLAVFGHTMYECEQCGRLWLQPVRTENQFVSYIPEDGVREVLRSDSNKSREKKLEDE